ncbi:MAG TPA: metallophosphoesterase, partial [Acidimicrobiia bacterium]|nr:metallophosphoesterase [Acidimicrobiia bacterium]
MYAADGGIFAFGSAGFAGAVRSQSNDIIGMATTPSGNGYWMADDDGDVFAAGDATVFGARATSLDDVAAFTARPQGDGYWLATRTGRIENYGQAPAIPGVTVKETKRITTVASTTSGAGVWMAGLDGGVFASGDAGFFGSMGGVRLNQPVVGMAPTPSGRGYWLVASDGGVFSFGDARFFGSTGDIRLNQPVRGMIARPGVPAVTLEGAHETPPGTPGLPDTPSPPDSPVATLVGAGDIAQCTSSGPSASKAEATAKLLDAIPRDPSTVVYTTGDNVYNDGTASEFKNCYAPTWGRHRDRTRPVPGNHDYNTAGATGYYGYFGAAAGQPGKGWYSYDLGAWHVVVLNSNCASIGGCGAGSAQEQWLRADLAASSARCTVALWHHPRFNSGRTHGNNMEVAPLWSALYDHGADVILNGHVHVYERFAPQTPDARADGAHGIRQFTVGTGGAPGYAFETTPQPNSEVRRTGTDGVLKLTLRADGYDFRFLAVAGQTFSDSGSGTCHGRP